MGHLGKWGLELNQFHVDYQRQAAIKIQVLANILAKFPMIDLGESELDYGAERVDLPVYDEEKHEMFVP